MLLYAYKFLGAGFSVVAFVIVIGIFNYIMNFVIQMNRCYSVEYNFVTCYVSYFLLYTIICRN